MTKEEIRTAIIACLKQGLRFSAPRVVTRPEVNWQDKRVRVDEGRLFRTFTLDELRRAVGRGRGDIRSDEEILAILDELVRERRIKVFRVYPRRELHYNDLEFRSEVGTAEQRWVTDTSAKTEQLHFYLDDPLSKRELLEGECIRVPSEVVNKLWEARDRRFARSFGRPDRAGEILAEIRLQKEEGEQDELKQAVKEAFTGSSR